MLYTKLLSEMSQLSQMRGDHKLSPESDIVFQVVSWNALDHDYDEDSSDPSKYLVKVFGVTEAGASVSVNVLDFTHTSSSDWIIR